MDWSGKWTSANRQVLIDSVDEVDRDKIDHAVWKSLSNNNSRLEMEILSIARRRRCSKKTRSDRMYPPNRFASTRRGNAS